MTTETRFAIQNIKTKQFLKFSTNFQQFCGADVKATLVDDIKDATMYRAKYFLFDDLEFVFHQLRDICIDELDLQLVDVEVSFEIKKNIPLSQTYYNGNQQCLGQNHEN